MYMFDLLSQHQSCVAASVMCCTGKTINTCLSSSVTVVKAAMCEHLGVLVMFTDMLHVTQVIKARPAA